MAVTAWRSTGFTENDNSYGTIAWSNTDEAKTLDGVYASAIITAEAITNYIKVSHFGFDSSTIPAGSVVRGAEVRLFVRGSALNVIGEDRIRWMRVGTIGSANITFTPSAGWSAVGEYKTFGSATELGGFTWTLAQVYDDASGMVVAVTDTLGATAEIDHIEMRWNYDPPGDASALLLRDVGA